MKSVTKLLVSTRTQQSERDNAPLFANALSRKELNHLLCHERFLLHDSNVDTDLCESWFNTENGDTLHEAWTSALSTVCSQPHRVEVELVAQLPPHRRYGALFAKIQAMSPWMGASQTPPTVVRHLHARDLRWEQRIGRATSCCRKQETGRYALQLAGASSFKKGPRAAVHVCTEEELLDVTPDTYDTVRYKCEHVVANSSRWTISLICELQCPGTTAASLPSLETVAPILGNGEMEMGVPLMLLSQNEDICDKVLGVGNVSQCRLSWRLEVELERITSERDMHCAMAVGLAIVSTLLFHSEGGTSDSVMRPVHQTFLSVEAVQRVCRERRPDVLDPVSCAIAAARGLCQMAPEQMLNSCRPREITLATLPQTLRMAVTPKDDGLGCILFVVPNHLVWLSTSGEWQHCPRPHNLGHPAALLAERMPDGTFVASDAWVLPHAPRLWAGPADLFHRVRLLEAYLQKAECRVVQAKRWFYSPDDDVADLAQAIDYAIGRGTPVDGLIFCLLHTDMRHRQLIKFKPVITADVLVDRDALLARGDDGTLMPWKADDGSLAAQHPDSVGKVCEVALGEPIKLVRIRTDKTVPNLHRAVVEMEHTVQAFAGHRAGLDVMLRLRNGSRRFRTATNKMKRAVMGRTKGYRVYLDLGIGCDSTLYTELLDEGHVVGLELDGTKINEFHTRLKGRGHPRQHFNVMQGDLNDTGDVGRLRAMLPSNNNEPIAVVANWTLGYMDVPHSPALALAADVVRRTRGEFVGLFHDYDHALLRPRNPPADSDRCCTLYDEDGKPNLERAMVDLEVGAVCRTLVPTAVVATHFPWVVVPPGDRPIEAVVTKPVSFLVVLHFPALSVVHWWLLDCSAPNSCNAERLVTSTEIRKFAADMGFECLLQAGGHEDGDDSMLSSVVRFRLCLPRLLLSPVTTAVDMPFPPVEWAAGDSVVAPVCVPARGQQVWTLWVSPVRRVLYAADARGRIWRATGALTQRWTTGVSFCLRGFLQRGEFSAFDLLELDGTDLSDAPYLDVRHRRLCAFLARDDAPSCVPLPVFAWHDLQGIQTHERDHGEVCCGRIYVAAHRHAGFPLLHRIVSAGRDDVHFLAQGSLLREKARIPKRQVPISPSAAVARTLHLLGTIDAQVPGGVCDTVCVTGVAARDHDVVRDWASACGCNTQVTFEPGDGGPRVRALCHGRHRRPGPGHVAWMPAVWPLRAGERAPFSGCWDRVGGDAAYGVADAARTTVLSAHTGLVLWDAGPLEERTRVILFDEPVGWVELLIASDGTDDVGVVAARGRPHSAEGRDCQGPPGLAGVAAGVAGARKRNAACDAGLLAPGAAAKRARVAPP
jgi:hypothetical protein